MHYPIPKLRKSAIISGKPCNLSEKLKTLTKLQLPEILIFFAEIMHTFPA